MYSHLDIKGWGQLPYDLFSQIVFNNYESSPLNIVEVGVAYGRSVICLAEQLNLANCEATIYAIDIWQSQRQYEQ